MKKESLILSALLFFAVTSIIHAHEGHDHTAGESRVRINQEIRTQNSREETTTTELRIRQQGQGEVKINADTSARGDSLEREGGDRSTRDQRTSEQVAVSIQDLHNRWTTRWQMLFERLSKIFIKIQSRVEKMNEAGFDTTESQVKIEEMVELFGQAEEMLKELSEKEYVVNDDMSKDQQKEVVMQVREDHKELRDKLKEIHQEMVELVSQLKSLS